jgi:hypothetical protein
MSEEKTVESKDELNESAEPKTYTEEQFNGLLADKQAEVKRRQELQRQVDELKAKDSQKETLPPGENGGSTDDENRPVTIAEFKKLMAEQRKTDAEADFALREKQSTEAAMKEYTAEKCGEGLDFESVVSAGGSNLTEGDLLAIRKSKDPAAEKYRRCVMLTDELSQKAQALRNSDMLEKIKLTGRIPGTGSAEVSASADDVSKMSEEELDRLASSLG